MIRFLFFFFLFLDFVCVSQKSRNLTLLDKWTEDSIFVSGKSKVRFNECWGFVRENREYAIIGSNSGAYLFEIRNQNLNFIQYIAGNSQGPTIVHRDYHDYKNYLYAVTDEGKGKLQIMDLTYLPDSVHLVYQQDSLFSQAHNIFIDTSSSKLYACGPSTGFGMSVYSLENPVIPKLITHYSDAEYVHDAYVIRDTAYLNCAEEGLKIVDFSNNEYYFEIASLSFYIDQGYNHSGWLSPDGKTYFFCDETVGKRIKKCNLENFPDIDVERLFGTNYLNKSVAHNIMVTDKFIFVSYYKEGLRIYDYSITPIKEIAYYDTFDEESKYPFSGAWGIYRFTKSSHIIVSDRQNGLFLFEFDYQIPSISNDNPVVLLFPNPIFGNQNIIFYVNEFLADKFYCDIFDMKGKKVISTIKKSNYFKINQKLSSGIYTYSIRFNDNLNEMKSYFGKIVVN